MWYEKGKSTNKPWDTSQVIIHLFAHSLVQAFVRCVVSYVRTFCFAAYFTLFLCLLMKKIYKHACNYDHLRVERYGCAYEQRTCGTKDAERSEQRTIWHFGLVLFTHLQNSECIAREILITAPSRMWTRISLFSRSLCRSGSVSRAPHLIIRTLHGNGCWLYRSGSLNSCVRDHRF